MSLNSQDRYELDELLDRLFSGTIDESSKERLSNLLCSSEDAQSIYLDTAAVHGALVFRSSLQSAANGFAVTTAGPPLEESCTSTFEDLTRPSPAPVATPALTGRVASLNRSIFASILAVAITFYGGFILISWNLRSGSLPRGTDGTDLVVATIGNATNVEWRERPRFTAGPAEDQRIRQGEPLQIESGLVEVQLSQGTLLLIEGPARWSIAGENAATLEVGRVVALVPESAKGFLLETPSARIVDLGTEFGAATDATGSTKVQIFQGSVDLSPRGNGHLLVDGQRLRKSQRLIAGQKMFVTADSSANIVEPAADEHFVRRLPAPVEPGTPFIAYDVPATTKGNQIYDGNLGMDFDLLAPVEVTALGAFDDGGDGFAPGTTITVEIWQRNNLQTPEEPVDDRGEGLAATVQFTAEMPGELKGGSRFLPLKTPLRLIPGSFTIVARGFNAKDRLANAQHAKPTWSTNNGAGCLQFVGRSRYGYGPFPLTVDARSSNHYAAGTFEYRPLLKIDSSVTNKP